MARLATSGLGSDTVASTSSRGCPDWSAIAEAAIIGAVSAVAFALGIAAACPDESGLDKLPQSVLEGAFGAALGEFLEQLTDNAALAGIVAAFSTAFIFRLLAPEICPD